jgi:hypothetical protein
MASCSLLLQLASCSVHVLRASVLPLVLLLLSLLLLSLLARRVKYPNKSRQPETAKEKSFIELQVEKLQETNKCFVQLRVRSKTVNFTLCVMASVLAAVLLLLLLLQPPPTA